MNAIQVAKLVSALALYIFAFFMHTISTGFVFNLTSLFVLIPLVMRSIILNSWLAVDWGFMVGVVMMSTFFMWALSAMSDEIAEGIRTFGEDENKNRKVIGAYIAMITLSVLIFTPMYKGGDPYAGSRSVNNALLNNTF